MRIALGPLLYYWPRAQVEQYYDEAARVPLDIVYLGEVVCGKRHELHSSDWVAIGRALAAAGKTVVLSSLALPESETDLRLVRRLVANGEFAIEANDMSAVSAAAQARVPFVIGPHINAYNAPTIAYLHRCGAFRWVAPVELGKQALEGLRRTWPDGLEVELFAYGRLPLAFSARCFTARAHDLGKDDCAFKCLDDPDGLAMRTLENDPLLVLNGIQTQSAQPYSVFGMLDEIASARVDVLRISPQSQHTWEIVRLVREGVEGRLASADVAAQLDALTGQRSCSGFWRGTAGLVPALNA